MKGIITANMLYTYMRETIKGQDRGLRTMAISLAAHLQKFNYYKANAEGQLWKDNVLIIGPTGSGKTELFRTLDGSSLIDVPMLMINVCEFTPPAWRGERKFADCLKDLVNKVEPMVSHIEDYTKRNEYRKQLVENAIIFIDEFDKRALPPVRTSDVSLEQDFQNEMLKIIEGTIVSVSDEDLPSIDTSKMLFVLLGAFESLTTKAKVNKPVGFRDVDSNIQNELISREQIVKYGFKRELMGRIPNIVEFNQLTVADLVDIMKHSKTSLIKQYGEFCKHLGVTMQLDEDVYKLIAERVLLEKAGARGLQSVMKDVLEPVMYNVLSNKCDTIHITKSLVEGKEVSHDG